MEIILKCVIISYFVCFLGKSTNIFREELLSTKEKTNAQNLQIFLRVHPSQTCQTKTESLPQVSSRRFALQSAYLNPIHPLKPALISTETDTPYSCPQVLLAVKDPGNATLPAKG